MAANFWERMSSRWDKGLFSCVGLDSELAKIPEHIRERGMPSARQVRFNAKIVDATSDIAGAYKPNIAFYEAYIQYGLSALQNTTMHIRRAAPEVPIILDAKRGDIGNTNNGYVEMARTLDVDAMTVHPTLGQEAMQPFLDNPDFMSIVLCRTSNKGAGEFQNELLLKTDDDIRRLLGDESEKFEELADELHWRDPEFPKKYVFPKMYQWVALRVSRSWNKNKNCGLVVGATYPRELSEISKLITNEIFLLIPGVGKQGGDAELSSWIGCNSDFEGFVINSSSGIIFASNGEDFAGAARNKLIELNDQIGAGIAHATAGESYVDRI